MSSNKKNHCVCKVCHKSFRSKDKFKELCKEHNIKENGKEEEKINR